MDQSCKTLEKKFNGDDRITSGQGLGPWNGNLNLNGQWPWGVVLLRQQVRLPVSWQGRKAEQKIMSNIMYSLKPKIM